MKFTKKKNWLLLSLLYFPLMLGCSTPGGATKSEDPGAVSTAAAPGEQQSRVDNSEKENAIKIEGGSSASALPTPTVSNTPTDNKSTEKQSKVVGKNKNEKQPVTPGALPTVNGSEKDKQQKTSDPPPQPSKPLKDPEKGKIGGPNPSTGGTGTTHPPGETTTTEETQQYLLKTEVKYYYRPSEEYGFLKNWKETTPLKTGDEYIIRFESPVLDCYIYVYKVGEHDNITDLLESFPNQKGRSFEKNQKHTLPSGEDVFVLDKRDAPGEDKIYFLAFEKPNKDLENLYQGLSKARKSNSYEKRSQITIDMLKKLNVVQPFLFKHQP